MQRIVVDCRFAGTNTGLGRYTRELVSALLPRSDGLSYYLLVRSEKEDWLQTLKGHMSFDAIEAPYQHYSFWEQLRMPSLIRGLKPSLFFAPHFNVPVFNKVPFVCTIHDLILHRYPNEAVRYKQYAYHKVMEHSVKKSAAIIAVSQFTANEICTTYGEDIRPKINIIRESVTSVYCPRSQPEMQRVRNVYNLHRPFFLYVGNAKEHKNVQMVIDAYEKCFGTPCELILITHGPEVQKLRMVPGVRILRSVDERDLPVFYTAAMAFVTASLYEGYCLPIAEAQACGCPVIASNTTAIPEVADKHAILVEPTVEAFTEKMMHPPPRLPLKSRGSGWHGIAEETSQVLLKAIAASSPPPVQPAA